jgi:PAS domain S-box-containing protein
MIKSRSDNSPAREKPLLDQASNEVFLHFVVEMMSEGATVLDEKGRLVFANRRFYEMLGYEPAELLGRHWTSWCLTDDLVQTDQGWNFKFQEKKGDLQLVKVRLLRKNGGKMPVMLSVLKDFPNDYSIGSVGVIVDMTDRLRLESKYREVSALNKKILETISTCIMTLDTNYRVKYINKEVEAVFGTPLAAVEGKRISQAYPVLAVLESWAAWVMRSLKPYSVDRYKLDTPFTDRLQFVNVEIQPLYRAQNRLSGVVCTLDDVTFSAKLEEQIEISYRKLEVAHLRLASLLKRQTEFLADVSHELRTPLTVITGNIEVAMLDKKTSRQELREVLSLVESEVGRMSAMVTDLLTLTKMEEGRIGLRQSLFKINDVVEMVQNRLAGYATDGRQVGIKVQKDYQVLADKEKMEALLWNLVENGLKYTDRAGKVELNIYRGQEMAGDLYIEVKDNGIGIPEDQIELIFDRFFRVDKARSRERGGSGLGLSICRWIVQAHGGTIEVKSKLGKGSVFTVRMPILHED